MYYSLAEGTCLYGLETPTTYTHELGGKYLVWVARQPGSMPSMQFYKLLILFGLLCVFVFLY